MSLLLNTLANVTPVLAQTADAVVETAKAAAPAQDLPFFEQKALIYAAAFMSIGFAAIGSAYGCGAASCAAMGAGKKCYAQNKPVPFQLLIFAGAPLSQTIYGMIVMFIVMGGAANVAAATAGQWIVYSLVGILAGIAMGVSALWQGISAAAAADAFAETGKGFANQLMALGIVETVAIFVLAFSIVLLSSLGAA